MGSSLKEKEESLPVSGPEQRSEGGCSLLRLWLVYKVDEAVSVV
jgi:hypothetical protein